MSTFLWNAAISDLAISDLAIRDLDRCLAVSVPIKFLIDVQITKY